MRLQVQIWDIRDRKWRLTRVGTGALRDGALHVDAYAHSLRSSHSSNEARPRCGMSNAEAVAESISPPTALIEEKISSSWPEILHDTSCLVA